VLSQRRERQIRPRCIGPRRTTIERYEQLYARVQPLSLHALCQMSIHAVDSRKCISTIIQTAWSSSAAACWPCSCTCRRQVFMFIKVSVAAVVFSPHTLAMLVAPSNGISGLQLRPYLEVGSLYSLVRWCDTGSISLSIIPCVNAEPCVHLSHLNAIFACDNYTVCFVNACPKINPITRVLGHLKTRVSGFEKRRVTPGTRKPGSANPTRNTLEIKLACKNFAFIYLII